MGDVSTDTSMEDILSSIKRIIAEEGEGGRAPRKAKAASDESGADEARDPADAVLELREAVAEAIADSPRAARTTNADADDRSDDVERPAAEPAADGDQAEADTILSQRAAEASRGSLAALSRMVVKPDTAGSDTLEGLVREMLRPMLSEWLDANLPEIVERMVAREIARITDRDL